MQLSHTLTKENFWNEMMDKYPAATKEFCEWIDEYKMAVNWRDLFAPDIKFHHLPYAMQQGIWLEYVSQTLNKYFEQSEHFAESFDLAEDINTVFREIEQFSSQNIQ